MCGIGLVVAGVRIDLSSILHANSSPRPTQPEQYLEYADWRIGTPFGVSFLLKFSWTKTPPSTSSTLAIPLFSLDDLKAALWRRGPDSLGSKKVVLRSKISSSAEGHDILSLAEGEEAINSDLQFCSNSCYCSSSVSEEPCKVGNGLDRSKCIAELHFIGATLQLRGVTPINQPLVDTSGNILVYNGEIFGGIHVSSDSNDAEVLMEYLAKCCSSSPQEHIRPCSSGNEQNSVPALLSTIKGPWALIYWQASSRTVWFGRDAFGRRSLLVHWPTSMDSRLLLSSVAPPHSINKSSDLGEEFGMSELNFWEELPCGVYSIQLGAAKLDANVFGEVKRHEWTDPMLNELIKFERTSVLPKPEVLNGSERLLQTSKELPAQAFLITLREAVIARSKLNLTFKAEKCDNKQKGDAPVAVLFSGGLDSMILAALLDECLDPKYEIDLLNVSFDNESAPDRISARAGVKELKRISPLRRWKLVEIDADLSNLTSETKHVMSLINPAKTYMDLNIGLALWLAATGDGCVYDEGIYSNNADNYNNQDYRRVKYKSEARILLVGSGADEQCAGYGRHKTKYRNGSWIGLHEEMKLDMQRIWKRNLGRDDRCIADNGKEARFPFLDEHVIRSLLDIPLWEIADLDQPSGKGDKKILREVARLLGLHEAAVLPKRAIQFGSRIARESNRKNFGSNRAANQASAGSVDIYQQPN